MSCAANCVREAGPRPPIAPPPPQPPAPGRGLRLFRGAARFVPGVIINIKREVIKNQLFAAHELLLLGAFCKRAGVKVSRKGALIELYGMVWNSMDFYGVLRNFMEFPPLAEEQLKEAPCRKKQ